METTGLTDAAYWESADVDLRLNPKRSIDDSGLHDFLTGDCGIKAAVVMATSGTSGVQVCSSSKGVFAELGTLRDQSLWIDQEDVWLAGLSGFHVGGLGIFARLHDGKPANRFPGTMGA